LILYGPPPTATAGGVAAPNLEFRRIPVYGGLLQLLTATFLDEVIAQTTVVFRDERKRPLIFNRTALLETLVNAVAHTSYTEALAPHVTSDPLCSPFAAQSLPWVEIHIYSTQVIVTNPASFAAAAPFADRNISVPFSHAQNPLLVSFFVRCGLMLGAGLGRGLRLLASLQAGMPPPHSMLTPGSIDQLLSAPVRTALTQPPHFLSRSADFPLRYLSESDRATRGRAGAAATGTSALLRADDPKREDIADVILPDVFQSRWAEFLFPAIAPHSSNTRMQELFVYIKQCGELVLKPLTLPAAHANAAKSPFAPTPASFSAAAEDEEMHMSALNKLVPLFFATSHLAILSEPVSFKQPVPLGEILRYLGGQAEMQLRTLCSLFGKESPIVFLAPMHPGGEDLVMLSPKVIAFLTGTSYTLLEKDLAHSG
jgi:hypothetical protein